MSGYKYLLSLLVLFLGIEGFSQTSLITIKGKIDIARDGDWVITSKPVERFFNQNYNVDSAFIKEKRFQQQVLVSTNSFIQLQCDNLFFSSCYIDSASNISFEVMTDTIKKEQHVFFFGANAKANELLANRQLMNIFGRQKELVVDIIKRASNAKNAMDSLHIVLLWYTDKLHDLYTKNEISKNCYTAFVAETEQRLLYCCKDILEEATVNPKVIKMKKKELLILVNDLFSEYDPFNKKYFATTTLSGTIISKCIFINDGILPPVLNNPKYTWRSFAGDFSFVVMYFGVYDFAPNSFQQYLVGNTLLAALVHSPLTKEEYMNMYTTYQKLYPVSPYIPIINDRLSGKVFPDRNDIRPKLTRNF